MLFLFEVGEQVDQYIGGQTEMVVCRVQGAQLTLGEHSSEYRFCCLADRLETAVIRAARTQFGDRVTRRRGAGGFFGTKIARRGCNLQVSQRENRALHPFRTEMQVAHGVLLTEIRAASDEVEIQQGAVGIAAREQPVYRVGAQNTIFTSGRYQRCE